MINKLLQEASINSYQIRRPSVHISELHSREYLEIAKSFAKKNYKNKFLCCIIHDVFKIVKLNEIKHLHWGEMVLKKLLQPFKLFSQFTFSTMQGL